MLDTWLSNRDRNDGNLVVRKRPVAPGEELKLLLLNDHSHAMLEPRQSPADLDARLGMMPGERAPLRFVANAITDRQALSRAIDLIQGIRSGALREVIWSVPDAFFLDCDDRNLIRGF